MEVLLLGTAAAEAWPAPFCRCRACREARRRGGRDVRSRAGVLIDGALKVDYGPDTVGQMQRLGRDLTKVETLLMTHEHDDHLTVAELQYRSKIFVAETELPEMHVYGNEPVMDLLWERYPNPEEIRCVFHDPLIPGKLVETGDGTTVLPLSATHIPHAMVLLIERDGARMLYGHDSGVYPPETISGLADAALDLALFDCTYGPNPGNPSIHMGFDEVFAMVRVLRGVGAIGDGTRCVATHFSHHGGLLYEELVEQLHPCGIDVAYDGAVYQVGAGS